MDGYDIDDGAGVERRRQGPGHEIWEVEETLRALRLPLFPWQPGRKPRFVRIEPASVTGRRFVVEGGFTTRPPDRDASNPRHDHPSNV